MFGFFRARRAEQDAYVNALKAIAESQARTAEAVMGAVAQITATQAKQLEAINTHLSLFKTTEPPQASQMTGAEENRAWAEQHNFPFNGTPEEQARWIDEHDIDE